MKKNFYFFALLFLFMLSNQSCENNDIAETKQNTVLNDDIRSKGGPAEGVILSTQSDIISHDNGCYTFQINPII